MRFASDSGRLDPEFDPFGENVLAEIMEAVIRAWSRVRRFTSEEIRKKRTAKGKRKTGTCPVEPHENWITDRLAGRILNDPLFRALPFDVDAQKRLLDMEGNEPGRIDLYFKHRHSQRAYFAFEAKRLHVTYPCGKWSNEYSTYTSDKGMEAYVLGQYAEGFPTAGMLGYVMDGDTAGAWWGLDANIQARRVPLLMETEGKLEKSPLGHLTANGKSGALLGETRHHLAAGIMRLFHLLVSYEATESADSKPDAVVAAYEN